MCLELLHTLTLTHTHTSASKFHGSMAALRAGLISPPAEAKDGRRTGKQKPARELLKRKTRESEYMTA